MGCGWLLIRNNPSTRARTASDTPPMPSPARPLVCGPQRPVACRSIAHTMSGCHTRAQYGPDQRGPLPTAAKVVHCRFDAVVACTGLSRALPDLWPSGPAQSRIQGDDRRSCGRCWRPPWDCHALCIIDGGRRLLKSWTPSRKDGQGASGLGGAGAGPIPPLPPLCIAARRKDSLFPGAAAD